MENLTSKWIFSALAICFSALLFGGVDLWSQVIVLSFLGCGVKVRPLRGDAFPVYLWGMALFFLGAVLFKELLPAGWFPSTIWRSTLQRDFEVSLSAFHHAVPIRLIQTLLTGIGVGLFYWWWRSFPETRALRIHLAWSGFITALIVALCSFWFRDAAIFKLRETVGYDGFGPFPNRNHSASFLVMGLFLGWGCAWEALRHRLTMQCISVVAGMGVIMVALIAANSRGALAAGGIAFVAVLVVIYFQKNDFRFLVVGIAIVVMGVSIIGISGTVLMKRFAVEGGSKNLLSGRVEIWKDAMKSIQDAPLLGHGVGMYEKIQPFYQTFEKPNHQVFHPENAYLELISEMGIPLVLLALGMGIILLIPAWDEMRSEHQFPLRVCALGGVLALMVHGLVDVPFLRWGNAIMGVLCWSIFTATRLPSYDETQGGKNRSFWIPCGCCLGLAWVAWTTGARWGEVDLSKQSVLKLEQGVMRDPMEGRGHHYLGMYWVRSAATRERAYREFQLSHELLPSVWTFPVEAARAVQPYSEGVALSFWGRGIERAGHRKPEIFQLAMDQTSRLPHAVLFWKRFIEVHPELIPFYLMREKSVETAALFEIWKERRGKLKGFELEEGELRYFYEAIVQAEAAVYWDEWIQRQPESQPTEWVAWGRVYHQLGESEKGWGWISKSWVPAVYPEVSQGNGEALKSEWLQNPKNWVSSRRWVEWLHVNKREEERDQVLIQLALLPNAPLWFKQHAAEAFAERKDFSSAVQMIVSPHH